MTQQPNPVLFEPDEPRDCAEPVPAAADVYPVIGDEVGLDALIIVDSPTIGSAREDMAPAMEAYAKAGIKLQLSFMAHYFQPDSRREYDTTRPGDAINTQTLMDAARDLFPKRERPEGVDLVYVLTSKELWAGHPTVEDGPYRRYVAGQADCIGGVRYPDRAFAVGDWDQEIDFFGVRVTPDYTALVASHEMGHLMGAHHQYAICGPPGARTDHPRSDVCTTMFPEITPTSLQFSPVNSAIIYGHAKKYAQ